MTPTSIPAETGIRLTEAERRARSSRNRAIGLALAGLVALFYVVTLAKLGLHLPFKG
ncbi:hypothetical protein [Pinisolibacter sp.]|uniref:hypothetical protein n=1 Tax=Pinisolibacter sp. TaxID=2172024 RepID=UPI002FDD2584